MKTKFKVLVILPLLLFAPALMAISPEEKDSRGSYNDFTVTIKAVKDIQDSEFPKPEAVPDKQTQVYKLYEFTINNFGDCYLDKVDIYQSGHPCIEPIESKDGVEDNFKTLIKPKEVCSITAYVNTYDWRIEEGEFDNFFGTGYSIRNDVLNIEGPYNISITDSGTLKVLNIDCEMNELKSLESSKAHYSYYYAIDMTYDGKSFCVVTEHQNSVNTISASFPSSEEIDPSKLTINNIDTFVTIAYVMNCEPIGITVFKWSLLILTCLAVIGIIFAIVMCVVKRYDKLSFRE